MKKIILFLAFYLSFFLQAQSDCISALPVCGGSSLSYTPSGHGLIAEELGGCMGTDERFTVWYTFTIGTSGTLAFTITPNNMQDDYDFAVYGPNIPCSQVGTPTGQPMRCNYSGTPGLTGLSLDVVHPDVQGKWSGYIDALAGETYLLVVDNFSKSTNGFTLVWEGTATLNSPFTSALQPNPFIAPGENADGTILICSDPQLFDFSNLSEGILNNNPNFSIHYYLNSNDALTGSNPITTPINVNTTETYIYAISYTDPNNPNNPANVCKHFGTIKFVSGAISVNEVTISGCNNNNVGIGIFDLTTANVYNGQAVIKYFPTSADAVAGTNEITNPSAYEAHATFAYALVTTPQGCTNIAKITLAFLPLPEVTNATLTSCNNNNAGIATYDLTTANVFNDPNATKKYFPTLTDLLNNTNVITHPNNYTSAAGTVYVEVTNAQGCRNYGIITLEFYPEIRVMEDTLTVCFIEGTPTKGEFDLTKANITTTLPNTKQYYPSMQDAINDTNPIVNPTTYISPESEVFVRVINNNNCWSIARIILKVTPPSYSSVLLDKTICIEKVTKLDAGPGYTEYAWSTGASTQEITNVSVGEYWVNLKKDGCITRQTVKVHASPKPIISKLDIENTTLTVTVTSGVPPYQYSLDGINWQESNIIKNVPRGQAIVYVKDSFDCEAVMASITVPNLVNAITPNDDNINDYLDYSELSYKKDLKIAIFDRYGTPLHVADKNNNYRWNGRVGNNKLATGNYWYNITWTEPDNNTSVKYSGWIMVKNR